MKRCRSFPQGAWTFLPDTEGIDGMVVGKQLAEEWKLQPGDYVTLTSPQGRLTPFGLMPRTKRFRVTGVFDSGFYDYDENWCFVDVAGGAILGGYGRRCERAGIPVGEAGTGARKLRTRWSRRRARDSRLPRGWKKIRRCSVPCGWKN